MKYFKHTIIAIILIALTATGTYFHLMEYSWEEFPPEAIIKAQDFFSLVDEDKPISKAQEFKYFANNFEAFNEAIFKAYPEAKSKDSSIICNLIKRVLKEDFFDNGKTYLYSSGITYTKNKFINLSSNPYNTAINCIAKYNTKGKNFYILEEVKVLNMAYQSDKKILRESIYLDGVSVLTLAGIFEEEGKIEFNAKAKKSIEQILQLKD